VVSRWEGELNAVNLRQALAQPSTAARVSQPEQVRAAGS